jgi:hypothetical protein
MTRQTLPDRFRCNRSGCPATFFLERDGKPRSFLDYLCPSHQAEHHAEPAVAVVEVEEKRTGYLMSSCDVGSDQAAVERVAAEEEHWGADYKVTLRREPS